MNRQASVRGWASRDPSVRWGAGAAVVVLWTAVAWADPMILLGLPLVAAALAVLYYRRRELVAAVEDDEDWF
jgi:hypothetical protein